MASINLPVHGSAFDVNEISGTELDSSIAGRLNRDRSISEERDDVVFPMVVPSVLTLGCIERSEPGSETLSFDGRPICSDSSLGIRLTAISKGYISVRPRLTSCVVKAPFSATKLDAKMLDQPTAHDGAASRSVSASRSARERPRSWS